MPRTGDNEKSMEHDTLEPQKCHRRSFSALKTYLVKSTDHKIKGSFFFFFVKGIHTRKIT